MSFKEFGIAAMDRFPIEKACAKSEHRADFRAHLGQKVRLAVRQHAGRPAFDIEHRLGEALFRGSTPRRVVLGGGEGILHLRTEEMMRYIS